MGKQLRYYKKIKVVNWMAFGMTMMVSLFLLPAIPEFEKVGNNIFTVVVNGQAVGCVADEVSAKELLQEARLSLAKRTEGMLLADVEMELEGAEVIFGQLDSEKSVLDSMETAIQSKEKQTLRRSYTMKVNEYMVNLSSNEEVERLLQECINKYDTQNKYQVELLLNPERELNVFTAKVSEISESKVMEGVEALPEAGLEAEFSKMLEGVEAVGEKEFSAYELGMKQIDFAETVEVVEAYLLEEELTPLQEAIDEVTKEQEKEELYEVVSGDSLSVISLKTNIPMEKIIEMNDHLENENSTIRAGEALIITVPEPELSIVRVEENYYEEDYDAPIEYVYNDSWFTNQKVTLQEPSAGHRKIVASVTYRNDTETAREILKEEVVMESVPKIVEKGTKIPPTYIKPISGGRMTSGFGNRNAPTRGATSYHGAIDWATPVGTSVAASSAGRVTRAGWGSGYGYCVYIQHADGLETRYAHLSKVLVSVGQTVEQGQRIALSGNTGISTGPHVHFEILRNGAKLNPMTYLQ